MPRLPVQLVTSNRLEELAAHLSRCVAGPVADPLQAEVIVVQNRGMATWLEQELARRNGVAFGCRFPFPRHLLFEIFAAVCPGQRVEDRFDPESLTWALHAELGRIAAQPTPDIFAQLTRYLQGNNAALRRFQLARRLATLFDDYLTYRPEMILAWEAGNPASPPLNDGRWQAELWRRVAGTDRPLHLARLAHEVEQRLRSDAAFTGLPARVAIFGISSLAPLYLRIFDALARHCEVTFYRLAPSAAYTGEFVTAREEQRRLRRHGLPADAAESAHLERGHRLLASLGRQGAKFSGLIEEFDWHADDEDRFVAPAADSRLHALQATFLQPDDVPPLPAEEDSILVQSCHSPVRELQVLRDHLLRWFEQGLRPRDVLVLAPDLDTYAPLIPAVFGDAADDGPAIPHSVADRSLRYQASLIGSFQHLLQLARGRFTAGEVVTLLEESALQRRVGFTADDLEHIRHWLKEAPVWWGFDAADRAALGLGETAPGTWRRGLDRLLLGYALGDLESDLIESIAPLPHVTGELAETAGRLAALVSRLQEIRHELGRPRDLGDWSELLNRLLTDLYEPDENDTDALALIRTALGQLWHQQELSGTTEAVPLEAVAEQLRLAFDMTAPRGSFLHGGVTFCALQPMRSVPARVICVLGLNDDAFPRRPIPAEFDLMAQQPWPGDESRSEDDRYLFLETLLSARDTLYLSYVGHSIRDNAELPPSVVVSELLDVLAEAAGGETTPEQFITHHRLHPFSTAYFGGDPRLFSYSARHAAIAGRLRGERQRPADFCPRPLLPAGEDFRQVTLEELTKFFSNPAQFFAERRLGFRLGKPEEELPEREVFATDRLLAYQLRGDLVEQWLVNGAPDAALEAQWRETGRLPLEAPGAVAFQRLHAETEAFARELRSQGAGTWLEPLAVDLSLGAFRLTGTISRRTAGGLLHYRPAKPKTKDRLRLWLELLALAAVTDAPGTGKLLGWDKGKLTKPEEFTAPATAREELAKLLELYWTGLTRPLPLPLGCAWDFVSTLDKGIDQARRKASEAWAGNDFNESTQGESANPYWRLCHGRFGGDPFGDEFERLAKAVFTPLLDARSVAPTKRAKKAKGAA